MKTLTLALLGEFRLTYGDAPVTALNTARQQVLLAYLALHRGVALPRQQLAFLFWPDSNDAQSRTNLRNALFQLRNALPDADQFLQIDTQSLQWRADAPFVLDVAQFDLALSEAQQASDPSAQRAALERAIAQYGGDLLPGHYEEWLIALRERLQASHQSALDQLITLYEQARDYAKAIELAQRLLQLDPLRETTYARLMQLHSAAGDRATALRVYHSCATILGRELGVDPDPTTQAVYDTILNLETPQTTVARVRNTSPLIGRQAAWAQINEAWKQATRSHPQLLTIVGEAGIGKTRLIEEWVEWAQRQGTAAAVAHCYALGGDLAFAPLQEWLRTPLLRKAAQGLDPIWSSEVARLLPELLVERPGLTPPILPNEAWQRNRLFDALVHLLGRLNDPLLLVLDDIQWCDSDTLEWVHYLLRSNPQPKVLVVATLRREAFLSQSYLASLITQLKRSGLTNEIELARLDYAETAKLVANLLGRALEATRAEDLFSETEGNPLFVVEMVRATLNKSSSAPNVQNGQNGRNGQNLQNLQDVTALPAKVLSVIESRLQQLSPDALELARVAAVIGRAFDIEVLVRATESDEDTLVRGLDELWQQRVIREASHSALSNESYDFTHDKIREVAYSGLSPIRRRFLHRRVAQVLEQLYSGQLDPVHAQIATHLERAGDGLRAVEWYRRAAQSAHQRSALSEAIGYLERALTLLQGSPTNDARHLLERHLQERHLQELAVQSALGPLLLATKGYAAPEVERAFSRAWELCQSAGDLQQRFQILWGLGRFYFVKPDPDKGLEVCQQLLTFAQESGDVGLLSEAACSLGTHLFHRANLVEARNYLELCIASYDRHLHADHALIYGQDPCVVALAYLAWTRWCLGERAQATIDSEAAIKLANEIGHPYSLVIATTYASVQQQFHDNPQRCKEIADHALALTEKYGFTLWQSMATFLRGWSLTRLGDFDTGFREMQQSIELFRSTGAELGAAYFAALLAETLGNNDQSDIGLLALGEAFDLMERTQDRWCEAELYSIKAGLLRAYAATIDDPSLIEEADAALQMAQVAALAQGRNLTRVQL